MKRHAKQWMFFSFLIIFFIIPFSAGASGCCQIYYKLDQTCDQHLKLQESLFDLSGLSSQSDYTGPSCLINYNFIKQKKDQGASGTKSQAINFLKETYNNYISAAQWFDEVGTDYLEFMGSITWWLDTEDYDCYDGYLDECRALADSKGVMAFWDSKACEPDSCRDYHGTPVSSIPVIEPTNPLCWPEAECNAVCETGNCWVSVAPECPQGRGYCLADIKPVDLSVDIGGVTRVRDLGSYIALLYNYLIGALVIFAIVMIMYGGFRWITAAGDAGKIGEAKRTIVGAVVGLLLGLFSYTILNVVNPALLRLEMPRVKRIRPIFFEIEKMRCEDYETKALCETNPNKFSITIDEEGKETGGCVWTMIGFGERCVSSDFSKGDGYPGNLCLSGNKCNEGWCIEYSDPIKRYLLNPLATEGKSIDQLTKWCTNRTLDMPCKYSTDCKKGLKCDENLYACVPISGGRPIGATCSKDGECASGFCYYDQCKTGKGSTICEDDKVCNTPQGYKCIKFTEVAGYCCDPLSSKKGGDGCFTDCKSDQVCGDGFFCWNNMATFIEEESENEVSKKVAQWDGVCFKKGSSAQRCFNDNGCASGLSCGNYQIYTQDNPEVKDLLLAPGGSPLIFPAGVDRIKIGTCQ